MNTQQQKRNSFNGQIVAIAAALPAHSASTNPFRNGLATINTLNSSIESTIHLYSKGDENAHFTYVFVHDVLYIGIKYSVHIALS